MFIGLICLVSLVLQAYSPLFQDIRSRLAGSGQSHRQHSVKHTPVEGQASSEYLPSEEDQIDFGYPQSKEEQASIVIPPHSEERPSFEIPALIQWCLNMAIDTDNLDDILDQTFEQRELKPSDVFKKLMKGETVQRERLNRRLCLGLIVEFHTQMKIRLFNSWPVTEYNNAISDEDKWKILVKYVETLDPYERHYFDQVVRMLQIIFHKCNDTNITLFEKLLYLFSGADIEHIEQETEMRSSPSDGGKMFPSTGFRVPPPLWRRCEQDSNIYHVLRLAMKNIDLSLISIYSSLTKPPQEMRERSQEMA